MNRLDFPFPSGHDPHGFKARSRVHDCVARACVCVCVCVSAQTRTSPAMPACSDSQPASHEVQSEAKHVV